MSKFAIQIIGFAKGSPCPIEGLYLQSFDFDAERGQGFGHFTDDITQAKAFDDIPAAIAYWSTVSRTHPIRADGRPNRPLTASSVTFALIPENK